MPKYDLWIIITNENIYIYQNNEGIKNIQAVQQKHNKNIKTIL